MLRCRKVWREMETVGGKGGTEERVIREERHSEGGGKEAGGQER